MRAIVAVAILISGCAVERQYESPRAITASDLTLNERNHPHGYGRRECYLCHVPENLHQVDRLGAPSFPYAREAVRQQGLNSCAACHGNNGAAP
ncbi:MAG TPA: hypothetical protein VFV50_14305 [Bdellovibrionales bacterium]|nr:hypothetical protein [Bdellovibrionales bacterium]